MSKTKSKLSINLEYGIFLAFAKFIRTLSIKNAYRVARTLGTMMYCFDWKHRSRMITHILHSGIRTERKEAKILAKASAQHMAKVLIEIIKFDQVINENNLFDYVRIAPDPASQKMMKPETTCQIILATAHLGNWELAGGVHSKLTGIPMTSIMRPMANYKIGEYIYSHRSSFAHKTISKEKGLRPLLLAHKKGENITIVADQHANHLEGVEILFFGHPARAHATPALLHLKTGTPLAMPYLIRLDDEFHFEYHCTAPLVYEPTGDKEHDVRAIVQLYSDVIVAEIRKYPEQWLWAHRRWLDCGRKSWHPQTADAEGTESADSPVQKS